MADEQIGDEQRLYRWRRIRRLTALGYFAVLAWVVAVEGVPTSRLSLMSLTVLGLAIASLGHGWNRLLRVVLDWLPFSVVLIVYDQSRTLATAINLPLHESDIASAESWLFGGNIPSVWMQHQFYTPGSVHWYDALATLVYVTHFLATPVLAAVLWLRNRAVWLAYITRVVVLAFAGLVTYVLFPEAPPWLAARDGLIEPVTRLSSRGWIWLHVGDLDDLIETAQRDGANPVAAMPSLHVAFAVLVALAVAGRITSRWRYLLALYPIAMGVTLVYTGEHYVLDLAAGVAYALGVQALVSRWEWRRERSAGEGSRTDDERETVAVS
ncbi:MAG: phosphoesterase PA-phosphatase [Pseudonocardiales bacterium]|nr:MAG: phosphoesterase PA-phosphatase [Pseudonocardiales bacterium]